MPLTKAFPRISGPSTEGVVIASWKEGGVHIGVPVQRFKMNVERA